MSWDWGSVITARREEGAAVVGGLGGALGGAAGAGMWSSRSSASIAWGVNRPWAGRDVSRGAGADGGETSVSMSMGCRMGSG